MFEHEHRAERYLEVILTLYAEGRPLLIVQPLLVLPLNIEFILWTAYLGRRRQLLFTRLVSISGVALRIEGRERWVCEGLDKIPPRTRPPAPHPQNIGFPPSTGDMLFGCSRLRRE